MSMHIIEDASAIYQLEKIQIEAKLTAFYELLTDHTNQTNSDHMHITLEQLIPADQQSYTFDLIVQNIIKKMLTETIKKKKKTAQTTQQTDEATNETRKKRRRHK